MANAEPKLTPYFAPSTRKLYPLDPFIADAGAEGRLGIDNRADRVRSSDFRHPSMYGTRQGLRHFCDLPETGGPSWRGALGPPSARKQVG